jgi:hypothetical protein
VVANWTTAFLGRNRRQRAITKQQVFARQQRLEQPEASPTARAT